MGCLLDWLNYHETNLNLACLKADTFLGIRKLDSYDDIAPIPRVPKDRYLLPLLPMPTACFDFPMATACFPQSDTNTNRPTNSCSCTPFVAIVFRRKEQARVFYHDWSHSSHRSKTDLNRNDLRSHPSWYKSYLPFLGKDYLCFSEVQIWE